MRKRTASKLILAVLSLTPSLAAASHLNQPGAAMTQHWGGYVALTLFIGAILLVSLEEFTQLRKSKPVLLSAGVIWGIIGWNAVASGTAQAAEQALRHNLLQYAELMLVMLVVMTYINAMDERLVFDRLRHWLTDKKISYRKLFWLSGATTFCLSPLLDNLATALLMGAVIIAVEPKNKRFVSLGCINVVIAANAGGAFSPFGDITTLMVWQQEIESTNGPLDFWMFFHLFIPSLINFLIPAAAMHFVVPQGQIAGSQQPIRMRRGATRVMLLFVASIATAIYFRGVLNLPAVIGMLTGLSYLQFFGYYLKRTHHPMESGLVDTEQMGLPVKLDSKNPFDIFVRVAQAEWDTLLFLCGIALSVGGLSYMGYLALASDLMYTQWGATTTNISIGAASAVLENIPTMYAVLGMMPNMSIGEWLLITLATGIGGSLLSIGSAAGIALMGQSSGKYTFYSHLKWAPIILIAYAASILTHLWLNAGLF